MTTLLLNLNRLCEAGGRPHSSLLSHGALPTMTGVGRRRPRTGQPGTRRRSVNTIPPLVDERSDQRNHNNMESDNNTGQVATVRGRQAGGARDDKDSNKPAHSTPFVAKHRKRVGLQVRALRRRFAVQKIPSRPRTSRSQIQQQPQQEEASLQQYHVVWLVEQKQRT